VYLNSGVVMSASICDRKTTSDTFGVIKSPMSGLSVSHNNFPKYASIVRPDMRLSVQRSIPVSTKEVFA